MCHTALEAGNGIQLLADFDEGSVAARRNRETVLTDERVDVSVDLGQLAAELVSAFTGVADLGPLVEPTVDRDRGEADPDREGHGEEPGPHEATGTRCMRRISHEQTP